MPVLDTLISIVGTQSAPAKDITVTNVNFRDAAAVYEEQWEVPSGGGQLPTSVVTSPDLRVQFTDFAYLFASLCCPYASRQ